MNNVFFDFKSNSFIKLDRWNGKPRAWYYTGTDHFIRCRWNDWIHFWNDLWFMAVNFHIQNSFCEIAKWHEKNLFFFHLFNVP